ncbi:hypothetical protein BT96DRAFT_916724 [Gymnopus androsaceus JB14]|uniref:Yeast cell wall synthesis Kre9/Knh1-like N-terminal domain-containing protein n=1 Tax=Gymnopus androsaceus JB14 TaxID=1447944 RepID=A0A6A4HYZ3_9AGAR|nr:hypothetical protein BT96DRAFT_916724 [Gymnopus androsaceus JB14]
MVSTLSIFTVLLSAVAYLQMATGFAINTPTGNIVAGQQLEVTWTFDAIDPVEGLGFVLALLSTTDQNNNGIEINYGFQPGGTSTVVTIPSDLPTGQYVFDGLDQGNLGLFFAQTAPFTISGPTLTLDTPSGTIVAGQELLATWEATNGFVADPFELFLIGGSPEVSEFLGTFATNVQTSAEVTIPSDTPAGEYTLQAINPNNNAQDLFAVTATFTITAA